MTVARRAKDLGVTDAAYHAMLDAQGGACAIEGCNRTPKTRRFHVDHNHRTNRVRGLLCHWHNRILPKTSREAHMIGAYLERYEDRDAGGVGKPVDTVEG